MSHRPYPDRGRALRQLARHTIVRPRPATEFETRIAQQARAVLEGMATAVRPVRESLMRAGAERGTPLAQQIITVTVPRLKAELVQSAPGVLVMAEMARRARQP